MSVLLHSVAALITIASAAQIFSVSLPLMTASRLRRRNEYFYNSRSAQLHFVSPQDDRLAKLHILKDLKSTADKTNIPRAELFGLID